MRMIMRILLKNTLLFLFPIALVALPSLASAKEVEIEVKVSDGLAYSVKQIEVPAGAKVVLTLTHTGKMAKTAMGHNFVLLKKGMKMKTFAMRAMGAAKTDYIPKELASKVIAHTKLIGGGESDTITFDAPPPGEYTFLCSFPGHYASMNGKLIVQ